MFLFTTRENPEGLPRRRDDVTRVFYARVKYLYMYLKKFYTHIYICISENKRDRLVIEGINLTYSKNQDSRTAPVGARDKVRPSWSSFFKLILDAD